MEKKVNKKSNVSVAKVVTVGTIVAGLGAGAYYLLGPNGKKHQKKAKVWMTKIQKELVQKAKDVKSVSEPVYKKLAEDIVEKYGKQYKDQAKEIKTFVDNIKKEIKSNAKTVKKTVSKINKKK